MTASLQTWVELLRSSPNAEERYRGLSGVIASADVAEAVRLVLPGLDDADSAVRAGTARWLAVQAEKKSRPASESDWQLIQSRWATLLSDADPDVRFESARGLIHLDPLHEPAANVLSALLADDETQPPMLAEILKIYRGIDSRINLPEPNWSRILQHEQTAVREEAARMLGHGGPRWLKVAPQLLPLLDDEEPFVREEAAKSLGQIGVATPEILAALKTATSDEDEIVAAAAQAAILQLSR